MQIQSFVLIGVDPLGRVDDAGLQRLKDLTDRQHLRDCAQPLQHPAAEAGDAHLQPFQVGDGPNLPVEPAAHLHAGVAGRELDPIEPSRVSRLQHGKTASFIQPGVLLPGRQAEGQPRAECDDRASVGVVVGNGVADGDVARLDDVEHLQAGGEFTLPRGGG